MSIADDLLAQQSSDSVASDSAQKVSKPLILIVDDDPSQQTSLLMLLKDDYSLQQTLRADEAITIFQGNKESIMAVLLDIRLSGDTDGFAVFTRFKEINQHIPIIFITGFQSVYGDGLEIYKKFRPYGYIVKNSPNEVQIIRDTLASAVQSYKNILASQKADRLAVRNQTMAGLLHDLKNLMAPVANIPELIIYAQKAGKTEMVSDLAKKLKKSMDIYQANQMILFNFAKGENIKLMLKDYELNTLVSEFCDIMGDSYSDILNFEKDLRYLSDVVTDRSVFLFQVINNIVKNAKEALYKTKNGLVTFRTLNFSDYKLEFKSRSKFFGKDAADPVIIIADNGPGILDEMVGNFFEAYVTSGKADGSGLGTWMVHLGIVELLKGEIAIENRPEGYGLMYHIWLPRENK